jgi:hypothetical protein
MARVTIESKSSSVFGVGTDVCAAQKLAQKSSPMSRVTRLLQNITSPFHPNVVAVKRLVRRLTGKREQESRYQ